MTRRVPQGGPCSSPTAGMKFRMTPRAHAARAVVSIASLYSSGVKRVSNVAPPGVVFALHNMLALPVTAMR